jgi:phage FluMu protein Com
MFVYHNCMECGYIGEIETIGKKVTCPQCLTVNDVWFEGEEPPMSHSYQMYVTEAMSSGARQILTFDQWNETRHNTLK